MGKEWGCLALTLYTEAEDFMGTARGCLASDIYMEAEALQSHSAGVQVGLSAGGFNCQCPQSKSSSLLHKHNRCTDPTKVMMLCKYKRLKGTRHVITPHAVFNWTSSVARQVTGK